jgi:hypothetical protein
MTDTVRRVRVRLSAPDPAHSSEYWQLSRIFFSRLGSRFFAGMVIALSCLAILGQPAASAQSGCTRLDQGTTRVHIIHGRFARGRPGAAYCLYALAGQHVLINIKPSGNLDTQGYLRFAGTPAQPDWAPGSPGGIVFNELVPWAGKYWLVVGQRFNEKKAGSFTVEISSN